MEQKPGFRFQPTDEELINYYLKNKVLGNTWLVDDTISEINILNHHPESFSSLSRIKSDDRVYYYFFVQKQYKSEKKRKRNTKEKYWYWKLSGPVKVIEDKSGNKIGERQGLAYKKHNAPKGNKSRWVMHEYRITSLPHHNLDSYVICKIFDKGSKEADISNGANSSVASQSLVSDLNTVRTISIPPEVEQPGLGEDSMYGLSENDLTLPMNVQGDLFPWDGSDPNMSFSENNNNNNPNLQLQTPYLPQYDDEFLSGLPPAYRVTAQHLLSDQDSIMQEKYNDYRPKNSVRAINTLPEFEQPGQENVSEDDLRVPMNEVDAFDPKTLFSDYNHPNVQQQTPNNDDDYWSGLLGYTGGNLEDVFYDQEFIMQENRNDYRPKKSFVRDHS